MNTRVIIFALGLSLLTSLPVFGSGTCDTHFTELVPKEALAEFKETARALKTAINKRQFVVFPAQVGGLSLVPRHYLEDIISPKASRKNGTIELDSISLENREGSGFLNGEPYALVLKYYKNGSRRPSYKVENIDFLDEWIEYLNQAKSSSFKPLRLSEINRDKQGSLGRSSSTNTVAVETNGFEVSRTLTDYNEEEFGGELIPYLNHVAKLGGHWVDMGAGGASALRQFYMRKSSHKMKFTGVGYSLPGGWDSPTGRAIKNSRGRFKYIEGYFNASRKEEIGMADIITDVWGILEYTKHEKRLELLNLYISMLNPGGIIFCGGLSVSISKLMRENPGIQVEEKDGYTTIKKLR